MTDLRKILVAIAATAIITAAGTVALVLVLRTIPEPIAIASTVVSAIVLFALAVGIVAALRFVAQHSGRDIASLAFWLWVIADVIVLMLAVVIVTFLLDWGPGSSVRKWEIMSFVPQGELVTAGGPYGLAFVVFLSVLLGAAFWNFFSNMATRLSSRSAPHMKMPRTSKRSKRPKFHRAQPVSFAKGGDTSVTDEFILRMQGQ